MGLPFYEQAVALQQKYGRNQSVGNGLQTNGLLINDNWARFFKSYNFLIGISIDGPEKIHDRYRISQGGHGSWKQVVKNAKLLLDKGVAVNVLTVINDYSADFPEEIYCFHKELGFDHMQFIPCIEPDHTNPNHPASFNLTPEKYTRFLCTLFNLWHADFKNGQPTTSIRHFDSLLHSYLGRDASECTHRENCGDYLVVEHNGDVYSCDFFVEPAWHLGNVTKQRLIDMLNSSNQQNFGSQKSVLGEVCRSCRWLKFCYGGCPKDRFNNPNDHTTNAFCQSYKLFFEHADKTLHCLAQELRPKLSSHGLNQQAVLTHHRKVGRNHPCSCGSGQKYKKCCGRIIQAQSSIYFS